MNEVPCPAAVAVSMRPPMATTSERTTSMPTPRPASSVTVSAVVKPAVKIRLASSASSCSAAGSSRRMATAFSRIRVEVEAGAVVAELDADFVAFVRERDHDRAGRVLARRRARCRRLDAVRDAVAQQVLEGAGHAVEHAAVDFDRAADDVEADLLAGFLRGQADDAVEAVREALELDHARAQQVVLQVARQARLGDQLVFRRLERALQRALHAWRRR